MLIADTSVWVAHLRAGDVGLEALLDNALVVCHPFIIGEVACGNLVNRGEILSLMRALPAADVADDDEVMRFIETHLLMGKGLGYVDVSLLASAKLTGVPLWTLDKRLGEASSALGLSY